MAEMSREESNGRLSAAVRTTIRLLEDAVLFEGEVQRLLQEADPALRRLTKKVIRASKERGDSYGQKFIPKHLGAIYGPSEIVRDAGEPDDDDAQDDDGEEGDEHGEVELVPTSPYVFFKIAFYDMHVAHQEPYVLFGGSGASHHGTAIAGSRARSGRSVIGSNICWPQSIQRLLASGWIPGRDSGGRELRQAGERVPSVWRSWSTRRLRIARCMTCGLRTGLRRSLASSALSRRR